MLTATPSPTVLRADVAVLRAQPLPAPEPQAETTMLVDAGEPVFAGHYPGFPILPGVCLVEFVHRSVLAVFPAVCPDGFPAGAQPPQLAEVESARFLNPVFPGETVRAELSLRPADGGWQCRGLVRTPRGDSAKVRLRYRVTPGRVVAG